MIYGGLFTEHQGEAGRPEPDICGAGVTGSAAGLWILMDASMLADPEAYKQAKGT